MNRIKTLDIMLQFQSPTIAKRQANVPNCKKLHHGEN